MSNKNDEETPLNQGNGENDESSRRFKFEVGRSRRKSDPDEFRSGRSRSSSVESAQVYVMSLAGIAALNSCNLGYIMGVNAGVATSLQRTDGTGWFCTNGEVEALLGIFSFTALIGAFIMAPVSDTFGRRITFLASSTVFIVGVSVMSLAPYYSILMLGRAITGFGIGLGLAIDPMYISEISPPDLRGFLVSCSEIAINFGILLGYVVSYVLRDTPGNLQWRLMMAVGIPMPIILVMLVLSIMPESPRWLIFKNKKKKAAKVLTDLTGEDGHAIVGQMEEELEREQQHAEGVTWYTMFFEDKAMKKKLIAGVGIALSQQITAEEPIISYMVSMFEDAGIKTRTQQFGALVAVGIAKVLAILIAGYLFDHFGRKPLLIGSNVGIAASLFLLAIAGSHLPMMAFVALNLYVVSFSCGMGPGAWLIPTEVFTNDIRAKGMSACTVANRAVALILNATFLSLRVRMTDAVCYSMFGFIALLCAVFVGCYVPETKGLTLEQVATLFEEPSDSGSGRYGTMD